MLKPGNAIPPVSDKREARRYHVPMGRKEYWERWGIRFRKHYQPRGIKRSVFAEALEVTEAAIRHYENGTRQPKLDDFFKLCELAGADPAVILFGPRALSPDKQRKVREAARILEEMEP